MSTLNDPTHLFTANRLVPVSCAVCGKERRFHQPHIVNSTVGDDFPVQQARVRDLLADYVELGPVGAFGAMALRAVLDRADLAAMSGDIGWMLRSLRELKDCQ